MHLVLCLKTKSEYAPCVKSCFSNSSRTANSEACPASRVLDAKRRTGSSCTSLYCPVSKNAATDKRYFCNGAGVVSAMVCPRGLLRTRYVSPMPFIGLTAQSRIDFTPPQACITSVQVSCTSRKLKCSVLTLFHLLLLHDRFASLCPCCLRRQHTTENTKLG